MIYMDCPKCKTVREARIEKKHFGRRQLIRCAHCGTKLGKSFERRECPDCGNVLYVADSNSTASFPCEAEHARQRLNQLEASRAAEAAAEAAAAAEAPAPAAPQPEPVLIQWNDPTGQQLLHVYPIPDSIPQYSVLQVRADQVVVYDSDGEQEILGQGRYPLFPDHYTEAERLKLCYTDGIDLNAMRLNLGARLIFLTTQSCEKKLIVPFTFNNAIYIKLPVHVTMKLENNNIRNLMDLRNDLTDDIRATARLEQLVIDSMHEAIYRRFLEYNRDGALQTMDTAADVHAWLLNVFPEDAIQDISWNASQKLTERYGLSLAHTFDFDLRNTSVVFNFVDVVCKAQLDPLDPQSALCNHVNRISQTDYQSKRPFICEGCGRQLKWCTNCQTYVTAEKHRANPHAVCNICDICNKSSLINDL